MKPQQSTNHIFLVRPAVFYSNPETKDTNLYQSGDASLSADVLLEKATRELDGFAAALEAAGVTVTRMPGSAACPDHIFPGNWVSTHEGGLAVYYPMCAPNRRAEKTPEIYGFLKKAYGAEKDYGAFANDNLFLEGTGSLCLDRVNKVAYLAVSARSDETLARRWAQDLGYELVAFRTKPLKGGVPVYHTDLILFVGTKCAGLCVDSIVEEDRARVLAKLSATHEVVELSLAQLDEMCGNAQEVLDKNGAALLVISGRAFRALTPAQKTTFAKYYRAIVHADIPTVEAYGGGSARCLILELF
jgi:hypothetical protein